MAYRQKSGGGFSSGRDGSKNAGGPPSFRDGQPVYKEGNRDGRGKKPYPARDGEGRGYGKKPYEGGAQGENRGYGKKTYNDDTRGGESRGYGKKPYEGGAQGESRGYGKRPYDGGAQGESRGYGKRPYDGGAQGGENRGYGKKPYGDGAQGESRGYGKRPYDGAQGENRGYGKKTYNDDARGGESRGYGKKPYGDGAQGESRGYGKRTYNDSAQGESRGYGKKTYNDDARGGEGRSYGKKPYGESAQENRGYGKRPYEGGAQGGENRGYGKKPYEGGAQGENRGYGKKPYGARDEDAAAIERPDELPLIAMGRQAVKECIKSGRSVNSILVVSEMDGSLREIVGLARDAGIQVREGSRAKLDELCMPFGHGGKTGNHQGIAAYLAGVEYCSVSDILDAAKEKGEAPFVILLDGVEDPYNLGSVIRSAECAGAHGVVIPARRSAAVTAAVIKASAGAAAHMNIARVANLKHAMERLRADGVWIVGADMDGAPMDHVEMKGPLALVIGGEGGGLSKGVKEGCDFVAAIPLAGKVGSLNAAVAAAVLMFEKRRQDASAIEQK